MCEAHYAPCVLVSLAQRPARREERWRRIAGEDQPEGALAPPVAEDDPPVSLPPDAFSGVFSDSLADVPPAALSSDGFSDSSLPPEEPEDSSSPLPPPLFVAFVVVDVVDVEVVSVASCSADVSFGGVISGVLFGTWSDTLVPPQALSPKARIKAALAASAAVRRERARGLTRRVGPSAGRRWDSR